MGLLLLPLLLFGTAIALSGSKTGTSSPPKTSGATFRLPGDPPDPGDGADVGDGGNGGGDGSKPNPTCDFGEAFTPNIQGNPVCRRARLAGNWVRLQDLLGIDGGGDWAGPGQYAAGFVSSDPDYMEAYTTGERFFLATVADGYGLFELLDDKPTKWSQRALDIVGAVANHPYNAQVLGRNSEGIEFFWKAAGWSIANLHPTSVWANDPKSENERHNAGSSYGYIWLPSE